MMIVWKENSEKIHCPNHSRVEVSKLNVQVNYAMYGEVLADFISSSVLCFQSDVEFSPGH